MKRVMKRFGLIGSDLEHVLLRRIHMEIGDYEYVNIEADEEEMLKTLIRDKCFDGFNIAHPFRRSVIKYLDELSDSAMKTQSVNTVKILPDGRLKGYNTEIAGFGYFVGDRVKDKKCIILGTGGSARSVTAALEKLGAADVTLVSRDPEEAAGKIGTSYKVTGYDRLSPYYDAEVIVNCTPVGSCPDVNMSAFSEARVSLKYFTRLEHAIDLIYDPYRTKFLQDAKRLTRCNTKSGLDMLIAQAIISQVLWFDKELDLEEEEKVHKRVKRKMLERQLNVVAVGFPGSGKTTIFRRYAYELGLEFIDVDEETEKLMGSKISDVMADSAIGEEYYRAMEHQAVSNLSVAKGSVIATGGGTLLNPQNRDILRSNGIVIYVKRPLDLLKIKGSPLNFNQEIKTVYNDRDRIYRRTADIVLINSRVFGEIKEKTGEGNSYNYELKGFVYFIARKVQKYLNELAQDEWT